MGWYEWERFPRAVPRPKPVEGKRNKKFGLTWWGKKWIFAVESKGDYNRMARGRAYARAEKVFNIKLNAGQVIAKVEGSLGNYDVRLKFDTFNSEKWQGIINRIRNSAALGVILNNQLSEDMDKICNTKLIPSELNTKCSCPDYENPCKHIAALYYVLADEIDKAPQILFKLLGIEREALFNALSGAALAKDSSKKKKKIPAKKRGKLKPKAREKRGRKK